MNLSQPPSWVASGCYIILAVAIVVGIFAIYNVFVLYGLPASVVKGVPLLPVAISLLLSAALSILLAMMQHWMCTTVFPAKTEAFAVPCNNNQDCTAVMGSPQPVARASSWCRALGRRGTSRPYLGSVASLPQLEDGGAGGGLVPRRAHERAERGLGLAVAEQGPAVEVLDREGAALDGANVGERLAGHDCTALRISASRAM